MELKIRANSLIGVIIPVNIVLVDQKYEMGLLKGVLVGVITELELG